MSATTTSLDRSHVSTEISLPDRVDSNDLRRNETLELIVSVALAAIGVFVAASILTATMPFSGTISLSVALCLALPIGFLFHEIVVKPSMYACYDDPVIDRHLRGREEIRDPFAVAESESTLLERGIDEEVAEKLAALHIDPSHYADIAQNEGFLLPPYGADLKDNILNFIRNENLYSEGSISILESKIEDITDSEAIKAIQHINFAMVSSALTEEQKNDIIIRLFRRITRSPLAFAETVKDVYQQVLDRIDIQSGILNLYDSIDFTGDDSTENSMLLSALNDDGRSYSVADVRASLNERLRQISGRLPYLGIRNIVRIAGSSGAFFDDLQAKLIHIIIAGNAPGVDIRARNDLIKNFALGTMHCCDRDMSEATEGVERIYSSANVENLSFSEKIKEKLHEMRFNLIHEVHRRYHPRPIHAGRSRRLYDEYHTTRRQMLFKFIGPNRGIRGASRIPSGFEIRAHEQWPMFEYTALRFFDDIYQPAKIFCYFKELINGHASINADGVEDPAIRVGRDPIFTMGETGQIFPWFDENRPEGYEDLSSPEFFAEFVLNDDYATVSDKAIMHLLEKMHVFRQ